MKLRFYSFLVFLSILIVGCATSRSGIVEPNQGQRPIFYPPPPDEPRLQFLASFSSSDDFEKESSPFKRFIIGDEKNVRPIVKPYGVTVHDNKVYICDTVHNGIDILDFQTRKFKYFRPKDEAQLIDPINLDFDDSANMYVADSRRGQVVIFDKEANCVGVVGKSSEFKPTDVLIKNNKLFICDLKTHSVKVYGLPDEKYLFSIPSQGDKEEAKLFSPTNLASDEEGNIYVSDTGAFKIQKYNAKGDFLSSLGSHGDAFGQFARPKGVALDKEGRMYVVDAVFENVQIFDKDGKLLLFFGEPGGSSASLVLPAGIAIDYSLKDYFSPLVSPGFKVEYLVLVTSQYGDRKLSIYGFGYKEK